MFTVISFVDENHDEIESTAVSMSIDKTVELIEKVNEFRLGTDRLLTEKDNWISVDLQRNIVEVRMKFPLK